MDAVAYEGSDLEILADMPNYYSWIMETFSCAARAHNSDQSTPAASA